MQEQMELTTYLLDEGTKKLPKWKRTYHIGTDGTIFVSPSICGMTDEAAFWSLAFNGQGCVQDRGHVYVSLEWLMRELPDKTDFLLSIRTIVRAKHL